MSNNGVIRGPDLIRAVGIVGLAIGLLLAILVFIQLAPLLP